MCKVTPVIPHGVVSLDHLMTLQQRVHARARHAPDLDEALLDLTLYERATPVPGAPSVPSELHNS
jgi:hypothetical protein